LYGTTTNGGEQREESAGVIFKIDANTGQDETLYSFDSPGHTPDGINPYAGLIVHGGTLYGATYYGGASCCGTVFSSGTGAGTEKVIYGFTGNAGGYRSPRLFTIPVRSMESPASAAKVIAAQRLRHCL